MILTINDSQILLPPLVAAMVQHLVEHQEEITRYQTGHINLDYKVAQK